MDNKTLTFNNPEEIFLFIKKLCENKSSGELALYNGETSSKVYFADGRISWAFASGQAKSFQSILLREKLATKEMLLQGIRLSKEQGMSSLDHILIEIGIENENLRYDIIEKHTASALQTIATSKRAVGKFISKAQETPIENTIEFDTLISDIDEFLKNIKKPKSIPIKKEAPKVKDLPDILEKLREELQYFLGAMIIDSKTGMPVISINDIDELDVEVVSAFYRDVLKSSEEASNTLSSFYGEVKEKQVEEILITTENDYVILQTLQSGNYILYVLLDKTSNPGMARVILRRYIDSINSFLK